MLCFALAPFVTHLVVSRICSNRLLSCLSEILCTHSRLLCSGNEIDHRERSADRGNPSHQTVPYELPGLLFISMSTHTAMETISDHVCRRPKVQNEATRVAEPRPTYAGEWW